MFRRIGLPCVLAAAVAGACARSDSTSKTDTATTAVASLPKDTAAPKDSAPPTTAEVIAARTPAVIALESFNFANQRVDSAAVHALSLDEARLLRGLVFGRHGRQFADDHLVQAYLETQPWYKPDPAFTNARLNGVERDNLDVIRGAEAMRHANIEPGDLRYHRGKLVTSAMLGHHTPQQWKMLSSELLAMNGHRFDDLPDPDDFMAPDSSESLQLYYDNRYWYRPVGSVELKELSPDDRALMDTIEVAKIKDLDSWVGFGAMRLFQRTLLTEKNIEGNDLMGLRLMRNEIYALHGREFSTPWLKRILAAKGYQPNPAFRESDLSETERQNIALIRKVEDRRHEDLSKYPVRGQSYKDMPLAWVRLLRNELYARHGRVFKDRALQAYFAGLPWYKPNPAFKETMLSELERQNAAALLEHETLIKRGGSYPEA